MASGLNESIRLFIIKSYNFIFSQHVPLSRIPEGMIVVRIEDMYPPLPVGSATSYAVSRKGKLGRRGVIQI